MSCRKGFLAAAGIAGVLLVLALASCRPGTNRTGAARDFNVVLITLDTTRADRLGCYGCKDIATPTIDRLAARGVRFERCYAQTPMTLPSHTTLMTGTLPLYHGVRDNGGFLVPQKLVTMAELFKGRGYETGAFVAAYVLDSKWGLNKGFDTYYDNFDLNKFQRVSLDSVERPANEVMDRVLPWLEARKGKRFFTWVHLYDPHSPYKPPPPYDKMYAAQPYLGEIAFADSQIDRLWRFLETNGLLDRTLVVFAGDHGESLGEHEEKTHGFFVYQAALHVPLIIAAPFPALRGRVSSEVVGLVDVLPTVCEMAGLAVPAEVQGKSLVAAFDRRRPAGADFVYSETYYPRFHFGWSDLKCVQDRRHKLILAPVPELYDVVEDPGETRNLVYEKKKVYEDMRAAAEAFIRRAERNAYGMDASKVDAETREKLAALGYVGAFTDPAKLRGKALANPREKIGVFNQLSEARELGMNGKPEEAIRMIRAIIASDPDITDAYFSIGSLYAQEEKYGEAAGYFKQVLDRKPDEAFAAINITRIYEKMGRFAEAEAFARDYLAKGFEEPELTYLVGRMAFLQKKYDEAVPYLEKCLALRTETAGAHDMLAAIDIARNDFARAGENLRQALEANPRLANAHYKLGWIAEKQGRLADAEAEYLKEIDITPRHFKALYNLARIYHATGRPDKEREALERCLEADPKFALTYFYLARLDLDRGEGYEKGIELVRKGIDLGPAPAELAFGYSLLAELYRRTGDQARAREFAERARALAAGSGRGR
ncbi:MAG TPA: sulfatase-like hydrolase/transferase [Terriglobales bacterium]|nr:sulfatase-like hydrolase/transferase [Terriglobales bacterium]